MRLQQQGVRCSLMSMLLTDLHGIDRDNRFYPSLWATSLKVLPSPEVVGPTADPSHAPRSSRFGFAKGRSSSVASRDRWVRAPRRERALACSTTASCGSSLRESGKWTVVLLAVANHDRTSRLDGPRPRHQRAAPGPPGWRQPLLVTHTRKAAVKAASWTMSWGVLSSISSQGATVSVGRQMNEGGGEPAAHKRERVLEPLRSRRGSHTHCLWRA